MGDSLVTIGVPVYNSEGTLRACLDTAIAQTYENLEILISDNASTDSSGEICEEYTRLDKRIRYVRQKQNVGAANNFLFLVNEANGKYFLWAAADDTRSPGFVAENVKFLEENQGFVASTSPNCYEGEEGDPAKRVSFSIVGSLRQRFVTFLQNCWISHGIFYSVIRTDVIQNCPFLGKSYIAADWVIDLYLASHGEINRTAGELAVFGKYGISSGRGGFAAFREKNIEFIFPLWTFSWCAVRMAQVLPLADFAKVVWEILKLNVGLLVRSFYSFLYQLYHDNIKVNMRGKAQQ